MNGAIINVKPVCENCGSDSVLNDGLAEWDNDKQLWVLHSNYDHAFCPDCEDKTGNGDSRIEWVQS